MTIQSFYLCLVGCLLAFLFIVSVLIFSFTLAMRVYHFYRLNIDPIRGLRKPAPKDSVLEAYNTQTEIDAMAGLR
tara:strand:+ start:496 stop:720 length:225 start_codon:yes stop_codon:yes gene_type:complete